ncbi:hypothetical protein Hanom_Chr11g01016301 [Helianthus anomalus]
MLLISLLETLIINLSSDSSIHSNSDSFESLTSAALQMAGLQLSTTDSDDNTAMTAAPSSAQDPTPLPDPKPASIPFGST